MNEKTGTLGGSLGPTVCTITTRRSREPRGGCAAQHSTAQRSTTHSAWPLYPARLKAS